MLEIFNKIKIPYTDKKYYITDKSEFIDDDGIINTVIIDGIKKVKLNWIFGDMFYDLSFLVIMANCRLNFPLHVLKQIEVIYIDNNISNIYMINLAYRFKNGPIEHEYLRGHYYIPYYSGYLITKKGDLWNLKTYKYHKFSQSKSNEKNVKNITNGYFITRVLSDFNKSTTVGRHRLIGLALIKYNTSPFNLVINHMNGVPGDDRVENLEWLTKRENNIHAINTGLMPNSVRPIVVKNLNTNTEYKFISVAEASRVLKLGYSKIKHRLDTGVKRFPDNILLKYDDGKDWPTIPEINYSLAKQKILAKNIFTNKLIVFNSIMDASYGTNINTTTITDRAKILSDKPAGSYIFRFFRDYEKIPEFTYDDLLYFDKNSSTPVPMLSN